MKRFIILLQFIIYVNFYAYSQQNFPKNGITNEKKLTFAFTNAKIFVDYKTVLEKSTLLIQDDKIIDVGPTVIIPKEAVIIDLQGKTIYPSFIDMYTDYGIAATEKVKPKDGPQYESSIKGAYGWNESIKADYNAAANYIIDTKAAEAFRKAGFGTVVTMRKDGICRGTATLVTLIDENHNKSMIKEKVGACYSFKKGTSQQQYPSSLMGAIALIRQTSYDAKWYASATSKEKNISLEAWNDLQKLPQLFESDDKLNTLRIAKIGDEFNVNYIIKTGGNEYQRLDDIKALKCKFILPLNFPDVFDLSDPYDAFNVSLATLKEWELAPKNPVFFEKAGIDFALTLDGLKDKSSFFKQIQKAIKHGLSEQQALKALTFTPANFLQISDITGALRKGMLANFIISEGNVFEKENVIYENWIQGNKYVIKSINEKDIRGKYSFAINNKNYQLKIIGKENDLKFEVLKDTIKLKSNGKFSKNELNLSFEASKKEKGPTFKIVAIHQENKFIGNVQLLEGNWQTFNASFIEKLNDEIKKDSAKVNIETGEIIYPFCAYGSSKLPTSEEVLLKNATLWTNEKEGILNETDILINGGKIVKIGKGLQSTTAKIIDATGKHITAGIIDEHSHIAATGNVNEGSHSNSAEVRIADIIDCDDVNIYRQLAGGVTTSHILHGSANAIGGQTQLIKLRWGKNPEQMKFEGADGFIKFALGENVKQTNWGDRYTIRYPQTRMGVEQIYMDAFTRAKEYEAILKNSLKVPVRKDLQLDAMLEIINKKRFITCHSYQQSEINMLMHVADSFKFKINTFTHILEGYKVADKMKKHGVGASTFSDWWAYKYEVIEAIPYNGAILNQLEVITAYNSDDAEMARRLNQEAAKAVKYGNVSEEDALKFVTLNPAKLLHIDQRVGSLKEGKDADIVLWSDHPLSIYAKALQTYVDGICYFDVDKDQALQKEVVKEKSRLIQKMQSEKENNDSAKKPILKKKQLQHCNEYELMPHEVE
ncbi:MAG TPA: amidohydrolase family protein [Bacteroidia bacterium]|nr:amidohydrolase family protein [Bacteroidia bacterium]